MAVLDAAYIRRGQLGKARIDTGDLAGTNISVDADGRLEGQPRTWVPLFHTSFRDVDGIDLGQAVTNFDSLSITFVTTNGIFFSVVMRVSDIATASPGNYFYLATADRQGAAGRIWRSGTQLRSTSPESNSDHAWHFAEVWGIELPSGETYPGSVISRGGSSAVTSTDTIWIQAASTPSTPSGGTTTEFHTPSGWTRTEPSPTGSLNVYSATRNRTYTSGVFTSATVWGSVTKIADSTGTGTSTRSRTFYQRGTTAPSAPTSTAFGAYTTPGGGWGTSDPGATSTQGVYQVTLVQTFSHRTTQTSSTFTGNTWGSVTLHESPTGTGTGTMFISDPVFTLVNGHTLRIQIQDLAGFDNTVGSVVVEKTSGPTLYTSFGVAITSVNANWFTSAGGRFLAFFYSGGLDDDLMRPIFPSGTFNFSCTATRTSDSATHTTTGTFTYP